MPEPLARILVADDEVYIREGLKEALEIPGYAIETVPDGDTVRARLKQAHFDVVILDLRMPGSSGLVLLEHVGQHYPDTQAILLTAHGNVSTAVEAMKKGAHDFLTKPVDLAHLRLVVERAIDRAELVRENRKLQSRLEARQETDDAFRRIVRRSAAMQRAARLVKQVAMSDVPVLLRGETGAGKELIARSVHDRSRRWDGPFVAVNCGGFTEDLFASELFGHKRGAFTSAHADRPGRFALAEGGTLFLDEIGEVPLKNQVELLRVLESREFQPLGDTRVHSADV
ncbi:MAG: sigma-54 dependent transcriptional regulator, partial [Candidatus Latescibacterota bacterium]|nr:sigma-54 dependent transcriptional regulator [Candidatus Latescibacterota bacterium]